MGLPQADEIRGKGGIVFVCFCIFFLGGVVVFFDSCVRVVSPMIPLLPCVATADPRKHHQSHRRCLFKQVVVLQLPFEPYRV